MKKKNYIVRPYSEGDEKKILKLMESIYGKWHSMSYWSWKYKENPAGFYKQLICLADHEGEIAGQYTIVPTKMLVMGKVALCAQSVDTATSPNYRRMGVFEETANATFLAAEKLNIPLFYGFAHVGPSYFGFIKKLDWNHLFYISHYIKIINTQTFLKHYTSIKLFQKIGGVVLKVAQFRFKAKYSGDIIIKQEDKFPEEINEFSELIAKKYKYIIKRDNVYLNYRINNPDNKYKVFIARENNNIVGYAIVSIMKKKFGKISLDRIAVISEIIIKDGFEYLYNEFVNNIVKNYEKEGIDAVSCSLPEFSRSGKSFIKLGFLKKKSTNGFIVYYEKNKNIKDKDILTPENWFITHLDSDHV